MRDGVALLIDPNQRVQEAIRLIFSKFNELTSVRQTYIWFYGQSYPGTGKKIDYWWSED